MKICSAGQHRQSLVRRVTADIRSKVNGVSCRFQKTHIRTMSVIHHKHHTALAANGGEPGDIKHIAEIIRRGQIDRVGKTVGTVKLRVKLRRCYMAGKV